MPSQPIPLSVRVDSEGTDPFTPARVYYGSDKDSKRSDGHGHRTHTSLHEPSSLPAFRRFSLDDTSSEPRRFLVPVQSTLKSLLLREDTDENIQITIDDHGPKVISLGTEASHGQKHFDVRGTYMLSNLLQELTLAHDLGRKHITLDEARLSENPVQRLSRLIQHSFWDELTRRIDASSIELAGKDSKDWTDDPRPRIYVPESCPEQIRYYEQLAKDLPLIRLDVQKLTPQMITPEGIRDLNDKPGLLALAMEQHFNTKTGVTELRGLPFVVPGGRFNEMYGWDSYMESIGLIVNERGDLAKGMVQNFCFCIKHYGKILNANRTYYLGRTQPPFLTDMALRVFDTIKHEDDALAFLREAILAAIKEYYCVWMASPRLDLITGLSRYRPEGVGIPPETEATHFVHILEPYAKKYAMTCTAFIQAYNRYDGTINEPELDEYFLHDRAVRESGHDTSYRLEKVAANLATIDLNALLYKYETDIARTIHVYFNDHLSIPPEMCVGAHGMKPNQVETPAAWDRRAKSRRRAVDRYLWNEETGMYFDYDTVKQEQTSYETATTFWAMWAGLATPRQAAALVIKALPKFEAFGGLVSGTEESRGAVGIDRPGRQWDYPYGWAPQQILAWGGLIRYGFQEEAERLAYKWLYMVTKAFVDFNGIVVEKYDVTRSIDPHKVEAEYGNQGSDFRGVAREGFGWVNSSYVYGLTIVNTHQKRALGTCSSWETFRKATEDGDGL